MITAGPYLLRPYVTADTPAFIAAVRESCPAMTQWMPWAHAEYGEAEALAWFALCDAERAEGKAQEFGIFDAESQAFVGGAGLNQINTLHGFCNLGYWVRQSWQRRGAALAAAQALSRHAFAELGLGRVEIVAAQGNLPSAAVAEKAGALRECLARNRLRQHGGFVDAYVFSLVP